MVQVCRSIFDFTWVELTLVLKAARSLDIFAHVHCKDGISLLLFEDCLLLCTLFLQRSHLSHEKMPIRLKLGRSEHSLNTGLQTKLTFPSESLSMELVSLISMFYFSCAAGTFGTTSGTGRITSGTGTTGELVSLLARVYIPRALRKE